MAALVTSPMRVYRVRPPFFIFPNRQHAFTSILSNERSGTGACIRPDNTQHRTVGFNRISQR